jgi:hypothetical protein
VKLRKALTDDVNGIHKAVYVDCMGIEMMLAGGVNALLELGCERNYIVWDHRTRYVIRHAKQTGVGDCTAFLEAALSCSGSEFVSEASGVLLGSDGSASDS